MKKTFLFLLCSFFYLFINGVLATGEDYWQQFVHYHFNIRLDVEKHSLTGEGIITYQNNSPDTLDRIYLHLYPNAFKNENSTMAKEAKHSYYFRRMTPENNGFIDILEFRIASKNTTFSASDAPVVAYRVDDTILESKLPELLPPGEQLQLFIKFYEKIPPLISRGGWKDKQHDLAQWYPKLVVYDEKGWHPDQYHLAGEFYGEFATFDVTITLPYNYIVAATGEPVAGDPGWSWVQVDTSLSEEDWKKQYEIQLSEIERLGETNKERTVKFHAEQVHDFAWLASPEFLYEHGEWNNIPIHVLYSKSAKASWSKVVARRGEKVLEWLSTRFGLYPYPQLSITHGLMGGGMEYPMLVMNSGPWERLISHEVGHIYFYGILASDELADAWMDEGFTTFQEGWYQQVNYGKWGYEKDDIPDTNSWKFKINPSLPTRESLTTYLVDYLTSGYNEPMDQYAQDFKGGYGINAYTKGAAFFSMLHYLVGDSLWAKICHTYFDRWKFKHVNEQRFRQVCEDVTGTDLGWFFDQWLRQTATVDYVLGKVNKNQQPDGKWRTEVEVKRRADGIMPVDVQLITADNKNIVQRCEGKDRTSKLIFYSAPKPEKVVLDPNDRILDVNRMNNGSLKYKFIPDLPVSADYSPRDFYVVRYAPKMWYNDVDGLWLGARWRGSYLGKFKNIELGLTYGIKSAKLGGNFIFKQPLLASNEKLQLRLSGVHQEGRAIGEIALSYHTSQWQHRSPFHDFTFALNRAQLLSGGEKYAQRKISIGGKTITRPEWEPGTVNKILFDYQLAIEKRKWAADFDVNLTTSQEIFGSDFNFSKLQGELKFQLGSANNHLATRFFGGTFFGDGAPVQERFFTDGANPRVRFEKFNLRSLGAMPAQIPYHFPGAGNLRGYLDQPQATERLAAFNAEISSGILMPLIRRFLPRRSTVGLTTFFDAGRFMSPDEKYKNLMDAGVGVNLRWRLFGAPIVVRFDFPVWVSEPLLGEKALKFRWLLSFANVW